MASHVSQCMAKAYECGIHGKPCVNMHGTLESYKYGSKIQFVGAARSRKRKGKEKGRKGKEKGGGGGGGGRGKNKGRKRKEKEIRKEKKKGEEERKKKEEKEGVLHSEQTQMAKNPKLRYKR